MPVTPLTPPPVVHQENEPQTSAASLLTLDEYKAIVGISLTDTRKDAQINALLPNIAKAIRNFTSRSFLISDVMTPRDFIYDGCGYLEIDDCTEISTITANVGLPVSSYPLTDSEWQALPYEGEVYYYLAILGGPSLGVSPEMGFTWNQDVYAPERPSRLPTFTVTATWGWPEIPGDVKLAAAWTIQDAVSTPGGDNLTSESIASYSRGWASGGMSTTTLAIPSRARDLLAEYQRHFA